MAGAWQQRRDLVIWGRFWAAIWMASELVCGQIEVPQYTILAVSSTGNQPSEEIGQVVVENHPLVHMPPLPLIWQYSQLPAPPQTCLQHPLCAV